MLWHPLIKGCLLVCVPAHLVQYFSFLRQLNKKVSVILGYPMQADRDGGCLQGSGGGAGAKLPDAEAYASAAGFDFGAPARSRAQDGLMPLVRGTSLSRGFALPVQGPGTCVCVCGCLTSPAAVAHCVA